MRFLIVILALLLSDLSAQTLLRRGYMGAVIKPSQEGVRVDSIAPNSSAANLKLKKNDLIIAINGREIKTQDDYTSVLSQLRTGDKLDVKYLRNDRLMSGSTKAVARPLETSEYADITYDWVKFRQGYLRTIVKKPKGKNNCPCILYVPGYGCGSIENYSQGFHGKIINEWLKNGYAVVTIEKSGMGDSYGCSPCSEVDLATDIESFEAGYRYMEQLEFVDKGSLFIWGHSMGGIIAPEIAKLHNPKGVMVFGTVFRPWSEFLLEMHRVQKPLLDRLSYEETERFTRLIQKVYYEFFVLKKSREELHKNPQYREIVESELEHKNNSNNMWGRHWRFWQQLDSLNLADSWKKTNCPVLVVNGGTDYEQCAPIEPVLIEQTVNEAHPGTATRIQIDDLDHFMMKSGSYKEAVDNFRSHAYMKGNFNYRLAEETVSWLNKQQGKS